MGKMWYKKKEEEKWDRIKDGRMGGGKEGGLGEGRENDREIEKDRDLEIMK